MAFDLRLRIASVRVSVAIVAAVAVWATTSAAASPGKTADNDFLLALEEERKKHDLPGVVASVVVDREVVFEGGAGFADIETKRPMDANTIVYPGSLSKVFTTAGVFQLLDEKRVSLDAAVARWVPAFGELEPHRHITIRHLLSHTSGLPSEANLTYWFSGEFPNTKEVANAAAESWLTQVPARTASYSNLGFAILGQVIERLRGRSYVTALRDSMFKPLGMTATGGGCPRLPARGYSPKDTLIPSTLVPFAGVGKKVGRRHLREYCGAKGMTPAFGLHTTAHDMGRFLTALLPVPSPQGANAPTTSTGPHPSEVLSSRSLRRFAEVQPGGRTLGMRRATLNGQTILRHGGWFAAHKSHLLLDQISGIGIYVTTNADDGDPAVIAARLWRIARARRHSK